MNKFLKSFSLFFIIAAIASTSCEKIEEAIQPGLEVEDNSLVVNQLVGSTATAGPDSIGCYFFVFPIDLIKKDGSVLTVNSFEAVDWTEIVDFVYPIELQAVYGGDNISVNSIEEASAAASDCDPSPGGGELDAEMQLLIVIENADSLGCYNFKYPLDILTSSDNQAHTVNTYQDIKNLSLHSSSGWEYVYPFRIIRLATGSELEIKEEKDIEDALNNCY